MAINDSSQRFTQTLTARFRDYGLDLTSESIQALEHYYTILTRWNERLHLVAPCEPEKFATRHVLESLLLLRFLSDDARVVDVGSGAGLPIIPCLLVRPELEAILIESSQKKSVFLREALNQIGIGKRAEVIAKRFEKTDPADASFVTCRALDQFARAVRFLVHWAPEQAALLLFGGAAVRQQLVAIGLPFTEMLIPFTEKRFIFEVKKTKTSDSVS